MNFTFRSASPDDFRAIRALIRQVGINPMSLDWRRFLIAVDESGSLSACGQVKPHGDGTRELASIAVIPQYRGQGLARGIIERLVANHPGLLYLTCRSGLGAFYEKFGFQSIEGSDLPPYFHRIWRFARLAKTTGVIKENLLVMKKF